MITLSVKNFKKSMLLRHEVRGEVFFYIKEVVFYDGSNTC